MIFLLQFVPVDGLDFFSSFEIRLSYRTVPILPGRLVVHQASVPGFVSTPLSLLTVQQHEVATLIFLIIFENVLEHTLAIGYQ